MTEKIFELIRYGAVLLIGFSLGRLWVGRQVTKKLTDIRRLIDDWGIERKGKFEEINKNLKAIEKGTKKT